MRKFKTALVATLIATMLFGCGKASDEAVVGISVEKLDEVPEVTPAATEETSEEEAMEALVSAIENGLGE